MRISHLTFKMKRLITIIYVLRLIACDNITSVCAPTVSEDPDYYWREYKGKIPHDAVRGGTDRARFPTYIGQAMVYPWGQLPASIYERNQSVVASANLETHYVKENVKILCSGSQNKFQWIPTDTDTIQRITDCELILGGVDNGHKENIGRVNYNEEIVLGKVIRKPLEYDGLWIPYNGKEIKFQQFEVLAFDCKPGVDVRTGFLNED